MPGIEYNVDIVLKTIGDPNSTVGPSVEKLESATKKLGREFYKLGRSAAAAFTGAVERAGALAMTVGKVGVAAGFGAAVYGVTKLNAGLETAKTSIGAVLNAEGYNGGRGFAGALARADGLMQAMRKHAVDLPGEFEDLFGIFQTGLGAAVKTGIDPEAFETMSANAMAAGKALAVPLDQAGRELAQLLGGRAGAHNVFGSRLGIDAHTTYDGGKTFNQLEGAKRVEVITKALDKFQPAIAAFGTTFDAASSTFVDNIKQFGGRATFPLFERVKSTLFEVNDWLSANQVKVRTWADKIGNGLVEAFDLGRRKIEEWWPAVREFASNAYDRITTIWKDVAPLIKDAGAAFKEFLANPDSIGKIESVLKLYAAAKVGGGVADTFGGVASAGLNVYTMSKLARGGAAAAGSTELATGAGAAAAGRAGLLGRLGGVGLIGGGMYASYDVARNNRGSGWVTAGSTAAGGAGGFMLGGPVGALIGAALGGGGTVVGRGERAYNDWTKAGRRSDVVNLIQSSNDLTDQNTKLRDAFEDLRKRGDDVGLALADAAIWAKELANMKLPNWANVAPGGMANMPAWAAKEWHRFINAPKVDLVAEPDDPSYAAARDKQKLRDKLKGTAQTIIGRVEITVSSNQAPGQIARRVVDELQGLRRHPRASRYGRRFDGTAEQ